MLIACVLEVLLRHGADRLSLLNPCDNSSHTYSLFPFPRDVSDLGVRTLSLSPLSQVLLAVPGDRTCVKMAVPDWCRCGGITLDRR